MSNKGQDIKKTFDRLVEDRRTLEPYWRDAFEHTLPHRGIGFINGTTDNEFTASSVKNYQAKIYDSTAVDSVRRLASSMIAGLTPNSSQWFNLRISNIPEDQVDYETRVWLDKAAKTMFQKIHSSNYNAVAFEFFEDIGIGGMAGLYIDVNEDGEYHFESYPLYTMYVQDTLGKGQIDTIYRIIPYTAQQAVAKFGINKVPDHIKTALNSSVNQTKKFDFIHCVRPRVKNGKQVKGGKLSNQLPWESTFVCRQSGAVVQEKGFYENPIIVPRWSLLPDSAYAVGPVNDCLADIKTLNKVVEMMLTNAEMSIAGSFVAKQDGILNPNTTRIRPRGITFAADPDNIKPLTSGGNFQIAFTEIERLQNQIRSVMMTTELEPIQKANPSATEVTTRTQLNRQILGPVYSRFQSEYLEPLIGRCFNLAIRSGMLGQPPQLLMSSEITVEYQSPLARAQRQEDLVAMDRYVEHIAGVSQIFPGITDLYDSDVAARKYAELLGVPADVIRSKEKVINLRNEQQKAQQEQEQQMMMAQMMGQKPA